MNEDSISEMVQYVKWWMDELIPFVLINDYLWQDLWEEANKFPLHGMLHDVKDYRFSCVNHMSEQEELDDENKRLCDVRPFLAVLKVIETGHDKAEKTLNVKISRLIGKGRLCTKSPATKDAMNREAL